jgi:transcriptional regulator with XRE-family HTH domain
MKQPALGKYITKVREAKGLTQEELVSQCNLNVRTLQRIESGKVVPRSYTLKSIAAVLNCDLFVEDSASSLSFKQIRDYIVDLFNLKTSKMKKLSILSTAFFVLAFSLYASISECYAQCSKDKIDYVKDNSRGFEILIPSGLKGYGAYFVHDTLCVRAGKDIIKEHNTTLFLNNKLIGSVSQGDTVIYRKGNLITKKSLIIKPYIPKPTYINNGIIYVTIHPIDRIINDEKGDHFIVDQYTIRETNNQIFLNDKYQGNAFANDTVFLRNGIMKIKHASKD